MVKTEMFFQHQFLSQNIFSVLFLSNKLCCLDITTIILNKLSVLTNIGVGYG